MTLEIVQAQTEGIEEPEDWTEELEEVNQDEEETEGGVEEWDGWKNGEFDKDNE